MSGLTALGLAILLSSCGAAQSGTSGTHEVRVGEAAPAFMLQDQTGRVRTLEEHRGHPVVLYFYPRDGTPGCTREACAFRDAWEQLQATGAAVLGVSTDDVQAHARFHAEHQLPFALLADLDGNVARQYGVPVTMGMAQRITFLIDADGIVRRVFRDIDPAVHADDVIAAIQGLDPRAGGGTGTVP